VDLGHELLILFLYMLSVARATRLINTDTILDKPRLYPVRRMREARAALNEAKHHNQQTQAEQHAASVRRWYTVDEFVRCAWCVGMDLSLPTAIIPVHLIGWPWWALFPVALTTSYLVGVFAPAANTEPIIGVEETNKDDA
jgi:hypothetical protein